MRTCEFGQAEVPQSGSSVLDARGSLRLRSKPQARRVRIAKKKGSLLADECLLEGLWRSPKALYKCDGSTFTCVAVVDAPEFAFWVGRVAIRSLHQVEDGTWYGMQAFRSPPAEGSPAWEKIRLSVSADKIIKYFDVARTSRHLVNGPVETYYRVVVH